MTSYRRLETPKLWVVFQAKTLESSGAWSSGALTDPSTSIQAIIEDSTGTVVQALDDMTKSSTGIYYYAGYTIPNTANTGVWHWEARGTSGSAVSTYYGSFIVEEEVA